jgi:hypothetical protein
LAGSIDGSTSSTERPRDVAQVLRGDGSVGHARSVPQLTAFFTSEAIFFSSAAVSSFSAKEIGHMAPWSTFALSLKANVA